jgi:hypothetical protein
MNLLKQTLTWLSGKKATIGAILALLITYALTRGYIVADTAVLLNGILVALGLTANIATNKIVYNK